MSTLVMRRVVDRPQGDQQRLDVPVLGVLGVGQRRHDRAFDDLLDHLADLVAEVFAFEDAAALLVDHAPLLVHDLVVLQHVLAAHEVELFDLLLGVLDDPAQHLGLDRLALARPQAVEHAVHAVAGEQADQVVFGRQVEAALALVALAPRAAAELVVDAPAFVAFGAEHVEAAEVGHALAELDVDAAAGHVGGDRHGVPLTGALDDLGLALVLLGVQHVVRHAVALEVGPTAARSPRPTRCRPAPAGPSRGARRCPW